MKINKHIHLIGLWEKKIQALHSCFPANGKCIQICVYFSAVLLGFVALNLNSFLV